MRFTVVVGLDLVHFNGQIQGVVARPWKEQAACDRTLRVARFWPLAEVLFYGNGSGS